MFGHQSDNQTSDQSCQHTGFNNPTMQALHSSPQSKTEQVGCQDPITMSQVTPIPISGGNVWQELPVMHQRETLFIMFQVIIAIHQRDIILNKLFIIF